MANIDEEEELNLVKLKSDELVNAPTQFFILQERIYKQMEHIKSENLLFESYLIRNSANFNMKEEEQDAGKKGGKGKKKNELKGMKLTPEEKYEIANLESEALKKNIEDGRIRSDSILETLRV